MAELRKVVKSRLEQQESAGHGPHPDANLLAAFAERTLLERERAAVLEHVAQCAECRETLALTTAALVEPIATAAPKRRWFIEWRWAGAAAAACCVVAVVLQVEPPAITKVYVTSMAPAAAAPILRPGQTAPLVAKSPQPRATAPKRALRLPPPPAVAQVPSPPSVLAQVGEREPESTVLTVRPAEPPAPVEQANKALSSQIEPQAFRPEPVESARAQKDIAALQAKSSPRASSFAQGMAVRPPVAAARSVSRESEPPVLWSINASPATAGSALGVVERSVDGGKTWEAAALPNDVSFRAVVAAGQHVWAGGTDGALFHSADGGVHWEPVSVSDEGGKIKGAIANIDVRDRLIRVTTSSGEKWVSSDSGRRWRRQ